MSSINTSLKGFHKHENDLIKALLKNGFEFNINKYISAWVDKNLNHKNQTIEQGFKIDFFKDLSTKEYETILRILKVYGVNCYYMKNSIFEGCIKEYLYKKGCIKGNRINKDLSYIKNIISYKLKGGF